MKKIIRILIPLVLLVVSTNGLSQNYNFNEIGYTDFILDNGYSDLINNPRTSDNCDCRYQNENFSFYWGPGFSLALSNALLVEQAKEDKIRSRVNKWVKKQQDLMKKEIGRKFHTNFPDFNSAKNYVFKDIETKNFRKDHHTAMREINSKAQYYKTHSDLRIKKLKGLDYRKLEIKNGNINNSSFKHLGIDGYKTISAVDAAIRREMKNIRSFLHKLDVFSAANRKVQTFDTNEFGNIGLSLKNSYYNTLSYLDKLEYMQVMMNYQYLMETYRIPNVWPERFNKFQFNHINHNLIVSRSTGNVNSIWDEDYAYSIMHKYEHIYRNQMDGRREALEHAKRVTEKLRKDYINNLKSNVNYKNLQMLNLIKEIGINEYSSLASKLLARSDFIFNDLNNFLNKYYRSREVLDFFNKNAASLAYGRINVNELKRKFEFKKYLDREIDDRNKLINISDDLGVSVFRYEGLSNNDLIAIDTKVQEVYRIFDKYPNASFNNISSLSESDKKIVVENTLFANFYPQFIKFGQNFPVSTIQWKAFFAIMKPLLLEIGIEFVPFGGLYNSLNDTIEGFKTQDAFKITLGVVGIIVEFTPLDQIKNLGVLVRNTDKGFTIFKHVSKLSNTIMLALEKGLKISFNGSSLLFKKGGTVIAKITDNILTINFNGFGGNLVSNLNKTTTLIGRWPNSLENIWNSGLVKQGTNIGGGGGNILGNVAGSSVIEKWNFNKKWLMQAISRRDIIRATANPLDINNIFYLKNGIDTSKFQNINLLRDYLLNLSPQNIEKLVFFGREVRFLFQNGYIFDNTTKQFIRR